MGGNRADSRIRHRRARIALQAVCPRAHVPGRRLSAVVLDPRAQGGLHLLVLDVTGLQESADPRCYLITHAHLDHAMSLIMLSGSVPPRHFPEGTEDETVPPVPSRIPVYGTKATLDNLAEAYGGGLWPELGQWASESEIGWTGRRKRRRLEDEGSGAGAKFSPWV